MIQKLVAQWMKFVIRHPIMTIIGSLLIFSVFLLGLPKFEINPSGRDYLGRDMPLIKHLIQLEQEYVEDINYFVMLAPNEGDIFSKKTLEAIEFFTESAWQLPYVRRVDSLTNFQHTQADGDDLVVEYLVEDSTKLTASKINKIKSVALSEPSLVNMLVQPEGSAAGINILFNLDIANVTRLNEVTEQFEWLKATFHQKYPDIQLYETGYANMVSHWNRAVESDIKTVFSLSLVIIFAGLIYFFANLRATFAVLLTGIIPLITGLGLLGLTGVQLNPASILGTLMVLVLGLADGIHVTKSVRRLLSDGVDYDEAIAESVKANFTPILLTSLTTAIGFLSFNFSGYAGVAVLGNYVAFGVVVAFFLSVSMLPAMLCYCSLKPERKKSPNGQHQSIASFVIKYQRLILILTLPTILVSIYFVTRIELDERITRYLKPDHLFTRHLEQIQKQLTGGTTMIYNFNSGEESGVSNLDFMQQVADFTDWARSQPEVRHVSTYTDTLMRLNRDLHGNQKAYYRLPDTREMAAQYLLLYELSLPFGLDLTHQINLDKSGTRVVLSINDSSTTQIVELIERNRLWMAENTPKLDPFANSDAVSALLMGKESSQIVILSGITALTIIGFILLFTFKSLNAGWLCVVSVIMPIIITYGLWGIFVGTLGLAGALSMCMVIGISVDFSVHFISKFVYARRQLHNNTQDSLRYAYALVTGPILTSIIVLGGGFFMLKLSAYQYNIVIGSLTATCIVFAALSALVLVPALLLVERFTVK